MAPSDAPKPAAPSLFSADQRFSVEVPPSPFAAVAETPRRPLASRPTSAPRRSSSHPTPVDAAPSRGRDAAARRVSPTLPGQTVDLAGTLRRLQRLARLDQSVFAELVADSSQTLAAVLVAALAFGGAAFSGWLWLIAETEGLSTSRIAVREFLLGGLVLAACWLVWVGLVQGVLSRVTAQPIEFRTLLRPMAFATLPLAFQLFMALPELAYGVGLISLVAWFGLSVAATEAAMPAATRKQALLANGAGFTFVALVISALGSAAAIAPGAFAQGSNLSHLV